MGANIRDTHKVVKAMLEKHPETRSSDGCLCYMVYKEIGKKNGVDVDKIPLQQFFLQQNRSEEHGRRFRQRTRNLLEVSS